MAESYAEITPGSGLKTHTDSKTIGANTVHDQYVLLGEPLLAEYRMRTATAGTSLATGASHALQIMAGTTLNVYVRWVKVVQLGMATAVAQTVLDIVRLTTAGTGGTAVTVSPMDSTDSAFSGAAMTLPTVKGTEGAFGDATVSYLSQTLSATAFPGQVVIAEFRFDANKAKGLRIPAGTANGIAVKNTTGIAAATCVLIACVVEANF